MKVYPILESRTMLHPHLPEGVGVLRIRSAKGLADYGATRSILLRIARQCERLAEKLPDVDSRDVKPPDLN